MRSAVIIASPSPVVPQTNAAADQRRRLLLDDGQADRASLVHRRVRRRDQPPKAERPHTL